MERCQPSRHRTNVTDNALAQNFSRAVHAALLSCFIVLITSAGVHALEKKPLAIITASGSHKVTVEVTSSKEEQTTGLMFRRSIGPDDGMIFLYPQDQEITMWMKNTYIPLDMIFVKSDGTVLRIEENTEPLSERIISSEGNARAVIEMKGGSAARFGIKPGDKIDYPAFK
jgi:uncharacterized protein